MKGFVSAAFCTGGCLWVGSGVSSEVRLTCVVGTGLTGILTTAEVRRCCRSALLTRYFFLFSDTTESESIEVVSGSLSCYCCFLSVGMKIGGSARSISATTKSKIPSTVLRGLKFFSSSSATGLGFAAALVSLAAFPLKYQC